MCGQLDCVCGVCVRCRKGNLSNSSVAGKLSRKHKLFCLHKQDLIVRVVVISLFTLFTLMKEKTVAQRITVALYAPSIRALFVWLIS